MILINQSDTQSNHKIVTQKLFDSLDILVNSGLPGGIVCSISAEVVRGVEGYLQWDLQWE